MTATAVYNGTDKENYVNETISVTIIRLVCNHAHTEVRNAKEATCKETGYTGYTYCTDCGALLTSGTTIPLADHQGGTATCTQKAVCTVCGKEYGNLNENNHVHTEIRGAVAAAGTAAGYTGDTYCTDCDSLIAEGSKIPPDGSHGGTIGDGSAGEPVWKSDSKGWWYDNGDGTYAKNEWKKINDKWYLFDNTGYMTTGWAKSGKDWYYLDKSGAMKTGWVNDGGKWYLLDGKNGNMKTGWAMDNGKWYYLDKSGAMKTGWVKDGSKWYYLESSGAMAANKWVGSYYLQSDGSMAVSRWIGRYYVGADGAWVK